ncbi:hypothetical protein SPSIL_010290 [Sporomusa silvacetica DSM 10669]|uniref:Tail specific protease domain-containing protein n=1 Tax=Sporomusa silvacetica DSM 10669 TaxID=1123289 RepID=A0ABZ3IH20_9FIRM|nr:peptidase family S41 [Sporomusa silvacetica DSM 10669]
MVDRNSYSASDTFAAFCKSTKFATVVGEKTGGANLGNTYSEDIAITAAEMIGATSGLGWYVKYFSDFADYPRVVAGIIVIGAVVLTIMTLYHRLTSYLLRWRK